VSSIIAAASGICGAIVGGLLAAWGAIRAVEKTSQDLESTEIRRQKVQCLVALYGLRWVISDAPNPPDDYKAKFNYEMNKIPTLWAADLEVMKNLRDFYADKNNERLIHLLRTLGNTTALPTEKLGDADIRSVFHMPMTGRSGSVSGR
jgi:hypothetical protein